MAVEVKITSELLGSEPECVVSNWFAGDGDYVKEGALLVELMVSKVAIEMTAPAEGVVRIRAAIDEPLRPGSVIAVIE